MPILAPRRAFSFPGKPPWWAGFGLSLVLPVTLLGFLLTGPHAPAAVPAWTLPLWLLVAADRYGPPERRSVPRPAPRWFFDGLLYLLALLQLLNLAALGGLVSRLKFGSGPEALASLVDLLAIRLMVGATFVCGAICPAHELIHRRHPCQRGLGRILLMTVGYDHFALAHKGVHHARLGSAEDVSTARRGESFEAFYRRALGGHWKNAWRADPGAVVVGLVAEAGLLAAYLSAFGVLATAVWLHQCRAAVRTLEAVNYFQHYGLTEGAGGTPAMAWRNDSAVSLFLFLGLTRHAEHHRRPGVPYPALRATDEGPVMPWGYLGMAVWVQRRNESYRAWVERTGILSVQSAPRADAQESRPAPLAAGVGVAPRRRPEGDLAPAAGPCRAHGAPESEAQAARRFPYDQHRVVGEADYVAFGQGEYQPGRFPYQPFRRQPGFHEHPGTAQVARDTA
ncbi:Alkane-1 monooxygenase [Candidatus Methylocalor cossyra]|uniref:Alkane-1 monooxygenase n=1 Tax=Candidatus Methylocalor cossyra TaxID=3108543 RepID=A0ABM9NJK7_9GAMM